MARQNALTRYPAHARKWAFVRALDSGFTPQDTVKNPRCIEFMITQAELYLEAQQPLPGLETPRVRTTKSAPVPVPSNAPDTGQSVLSQILGVGALRGLYVVLAGDGRYAVTLKITHPIHGNVYRYGKVAHERDVEPLLALWVRKGVWTPDKV